MIGDRETDVACAVAAGVRPILVSAGGPSLNVDADIIRVPDLPRAAQAILAA